jgi:flagellar basal-body rod protein FlgG
MIRALYTSATGMHAQETNIDVIANNLANVNTTGYKKSRADFEDLIYQYLVEPGAPTSQATSNPSGVQVGLGVKTSSVQKVFTQGDLTSTSNQLDLAIEGEGFFQVTMPDGTIGFTRSGSLRLDNQGQITTPEGFLIGPGLTVPPDALSVSVALDGTVSIRQPGQTADTQVGQLTGVRFPNNAGLRAIGRNLYLETSSSGVATQGIFSQAGFGSINQGFLESSNVSIVDQVVSMITAQRAYEASSKGVTTADEMLTQAINLKR